MKNINLKVLQSKYDLDVLELFEQVSEDYKVSFVANKLKQVELVNTTGSTLRLVKDKKLGFTSSFGTCEINNMITNALEVSKYSSDISFQFPDSFQYHEGKNIKINQEPLSFFKEEGQKIIESIKNNIGNVLIDVSFDLSTLSEKLNNTNDLDCSLIKNIYSFSLNIRETLENDFIEIFTAVVDDSFPEYQKYVTELVELFKFSKKHANIKHCSCPVLFTSKASKELFHMIELALNGKLVNEKSSPWHNKLGEKVLSDSLTIKQDPELGYMSKAFDDEGSRVQLISLINDGVLENFYYDLISSSRSLLQHKPTGNGFKPSLNAPPEPALLNMIISSGTRSLKEIIKDIDYGLLVDQTIGGLTANVSGDISVNVDIGFLIENGEIIGRVKDTMLSGNIYTALNNVIELSNNSNWYYTNIYSPDVLLEGFTITSR